MPDARVRFFRPCGSFGPDHSELYVVAKKFGMRQFVNPQHSRVATLAIGTIFLNMITVVDSPNGWREFLYLARFWFLLRRFVVIWMLASGTFRASFVSAIVLLTNRHRGITVAVRENLHWR